MEDVQFILSKILWDADVDFLWFPEPNFGGYCISRKAYEACISGSNIRFFHRLKDAGIRFVIHTCGLYDDRFDLVLKENANAWHISDTKTKKVKDLYGGMSSLMTTTMPGMPAVIEKLKKMGIRDKVKIMVGGAPVFQGFADKIGADGYTRNAIEAVKFAQKLVGAA